MKVATGISPAQRHATLSNLQEPTKQTTHGVDVCPVKEPTRVATRMLLAQRHSEKEHPIR